VLSVELRQAEVDALAQLLPCHQSILQAHVLEVGSGVRPHLVVELLVDGRVVGEHGALELRKEILGQPLFHNEHYFFHKMKSGL
jgi:hypothetical protein